MAYGYSPNAMTSNTQQTHQSWASSTSLPSASNLASTHGGWNDTFYNEAPFNHGQSLLFAEVAPAQTQTLFGHESSVSSFFAGSADYYVGSNEMCYPGNADPIGTQAPLPRKRSKELVGIGLYSDKEPDFMSTLNADSNRISLGKELKLEESWAPPQNEELNEDQEDCSSDEAEDMEDDELDSPDSDQAPPKSMVYPPLDDLSNHTFFFSDDEHHGIGGDNYASYLSLSQGLQSQNGKPQAVVHDPMNLLFM